MEMVENGGMSILCAGIRVLKWVNWAQNRAPGGVQTVNAVPASRACQ